MRKVLVMSLLGVMVMAMSSPVFADDNKVMAGAKSVGKGIMWGPKKLWEGTKKGFGAMGNGMKKMTGK